MSSTEPRSRRAVVRAKSQLTLPPEVREALHIHEGDEVEFTMTESGEVLLRGLTSIPADQRWFWDTRWQDGEREAAAQIAAGELTTFDDADDMFDALNQ